MVKTAFVALGATMVLFLSAACGGGSNGLVAEGGPGTSISNASEGGPGSSIIDGPATKGYEVGDCDLGGPLDTPPISSLLTHKDDRWVTVADLDKQGRPDLPGYEASTSELITTDTGDEVVTYFGPSGAEHARDRLAAGGEVVVGYRELAVNRDSLVIGGASGNDPSDVERVVRSVVAILALGENGSAVGLTNCGNEVYTQPLINFANATPSIASPAELVRGVVNGTPAVIDALTAAENYEPVPWGDQPADRQSLEDMPDGLRDQFDGVAVAVSAPDGSLDKDYSVCSRSADGWGECVALTRAIAVESRTITVSYRPESGPIGFFLLEGGSYDDPTSEPLRVEQDRLVPLEAGDAVPPSQLTISGTTLDDATSTCEWFLPGEYPFHAIGESSHNL